MISYFFAAMLAASLGPMGPDAPAREPQLAVSGSMAALAFGAGKAIYFTASLDGGASFGAPIKVTEAEVLPLNRHRGPRIAITGGAIVITAVTGKTLSQGPHAHGLPSDGDLRFWRSADGGKTWSGGSAINDVPGAATEGLHSLAGSKGRLFAAWLDKREPNGVRLYGARSTDGGVTWSKNVLIYQSPDGSICQCCHPSLAMDANGEIVVMWRNWLQGSRDMYLARSRDGLEFGRPEKLGTGTWPLNACPMDGGGIAIAGGRVVTAWRREREIFLASPGEKEISAGEGIDVAVAAGTAGIYAVWSGPGGVKALTPGAKESLVLAPKGGFPSVAGLPGGRALAAWETDGRIVVQAIP
jgi:BNR repeat protein